MNKIDLFERFCIVVLLVSGIITIIVVYFYGFYIMPRAFNDVDGNLNQLTEFCEDSYTGKYTSGDINLGASSFKGFTYICMKDDLDYYTINIENEIR